MQTQYFTPLYRIRTRPTKIGFNLLLERKYWFLWIVVREKYVSSVLVKHYGLFSLMSTTWLKYADDKKLNLKPGI